MLINDSQSESYDFVFIDADKNNYDKYYKLSLSLLKKGGLIAIDNVHLYGGVIPKFLHLALEYFTKNEVQVVRDLNKKIKNDNRVDISMLQISDGITLLRKK